MDGNFFFWFGLFGSGDGYFQFLSGVVVIKIGDIVVVDIMNNRIQVCSCVRLDLDQIRGLDFDVYCLRIEGLVERL